MEHTTLQEREAYHDYHITMPPYHMISEQSHVQSSIMASNNAQAGGYDCHWTEEPSDELKCLICLTVARDPHQHPGDSENECGKIFCLGCITEHQKNSQNCPNCQKKLTLFKDARSARNIRALKVKCDSNGCQWTGELGGLETHLQSCDHALIPCTNECKNNNQIVRVLRKDLQDHLTSQCPRRQHQCPHCEERGEYQERTTSHLETCPKVKVPCPNEDGCQVNIPRCELSTHRSTCDYEPVSCKYSEVGCKERPLRKDLKEHEENDQLHIQITMKKVLELNTKLLKHTAITPITFKLMDFQKWKDKSYFHSPPFFTSPTGYKIYVRVYTNGHKDGKDTHISIYANLMKGDNDDFLSWPFTGTVTFEILNQLEDKNHYKRKLLFSDNVASQRVVEGEKATLAYGWAQFIPHTKLDYQPDKNCQYLKDDTLVFRVSVQVDDTHAKPWLVCTI